MSGKTTNRAWAGLTSHSLKDSKRSVAGEEWDPEEDDDESFDEEDWEVPAHNNIKDIENYGNQHELADFGIGFLSGMRGGQDEDIDGEVFVDEDEEEEVEEEEAESTLGEPGWGKVINGMDAVTETKLYEELVKAYGIPRRALAADTVAVGLSVGGIILGYISDDPLKALTMIGLAWVTAMVYIGSRK